MIESVRKLLVKIYLSRYATPRKMIREAFSKYGSRTALIEPGGELRYQDLEQRVYSLAQSLELAGIAKGDRVFTFLPDGEEQIVIRLASFESGFILSSFHTSHSLRLVLEAARLTSPSAFIFDPSIGSIIAAALARENPDLLLLPTGTDSLYETAIANSPPLRSKRPISPEDPASLGFTSGTTGTPKALFTTHGVLTTSLKLTASNVSVTPGQQDRFVIGIPLVGAGSGSVLPMLFSGSVLIIPRSYTAEDILKAIEEHNATRTFLTPSLLIDLLDMPSADLFSLRNIIYGTAPMPVPKLEEAIRRWGPIFQQGYGMAEVLPPVSLLQMHDHGSRQEPAPRNTLRSAGKVIPEVQVKIIDRFGEERPPGEAGEIIIKSPTTFSGYWKDTELNKNVLQDGWYFTRDLGTIDQGGWLHVLGRKADLIKRGQEQIFPLLVEESAHDHPGVKEACLVTDQPGGEIILVVSLRREWKTRLNNSDLPDQLLEHMSKTIPDSQLPDQVLVWDELPRSYLEKILHREVRETLELQHPT